MPGIQTHTKLSTFVEASLLASVTQRTTGRGFFEFVQVDRKKASLKEEGCSSLSSREPWETMHKAESQPSFSSCKRVF